MSNNLNNDEKLRDIARKKLLRPWIYSLIVLGVSTLILVYLCFPYIVGLYNTEFPWFTPLLIGVLIGYIIFIVFMWKNIKRMRSLNYSLIVINIIWFLIHLLSIYHEDFLLWLAFIPGISLAFEVLVMSALIIGIVLDGYKVFQKNQNVVTIGKMQIKKGKFLLILPIFVVVALILTSNFPIEYINMIVLFSFKIEDLILIIYLIYIIKNFKYIHYFRMLQYPLIFFMITILLNKILYRLELLGVDMQIFDKILYYTLNIGLISACVIGIILDIKDKQKGKSIV